MWFLSLLLNHYYYDDFIIIIVSWILLLRLFIVISKTPVRHPPCTTRRPNACVPPSTRWATSRSNSTSWLSSSKARTCCKALITTRSRTKTWTSEWARYEPLVAFPLLSEPVTQGSPTWGACTPEGTFAYMKGYIYCTAATN